MTKRHTAATSVDLAGATDPDAAAEVKAWVARRLRFEHLLASLEHEAGYRAGADRSTRP
jgi:hypothetical protein